LAQLANQVFLEMRFLASRVLRACLARLARLVPLVLDFQVPLVLLVRPVLLARLDKMDSLALRGLMVLLVLLAHKDSQEQLVCLAPLVLKVCLV